MAPGTPFTDVDKPLHLHITPGACSTEVLGTPLCVHLHCCHCIAEEGTALARSSLYGQCPCWDSDLAHVYSAHAPAAPLSRLYIGAGIPLRSPASAMDVDCNYCGQ